MAYEKQTWKTGDVVTSAKLNHLEDGVAGGGNLLVEFTFDPENETYTCNKTFAEVYSAVQAGTYVYAYEDQNEKYLTLTTAKAEGESPGEVVFERTYVMSSIGVTNFEISLKSDNTIAYNIWVYPDVH